MSARNALNEKGQLQKIILHPAKPLTGTIGQAAVVIARNLNAAAIICPAETGFKRSPSAR